MTILESAQGWIAQPAAAEWRGGQKAPSRHPSRPKKCLYGPSHRWLDRGGDTNWSTCWMMLPSMPRQCLKVVASMPRQCLKVIVSQTKYVKWAKSTGQTSGRTDKQTDIHDFTQNTP